MNREEFLEQEIDILNQQVRPSATGHILTAISVLERELFNLRIPDVKEQQLDMDLPNPMPFATPEYYTYHKPEGGTISCYGRAMNMTNTYYVCCDNETDDGYWDTYVDMENVDESIFETGNNEKNWHNICEWVNKNWSGDVEQIESDE